MRNEHFSKFSEVTRITIKMTSPSLNMTFFKRFRCADAHCGSLRGAGPEGGRARRYAHNVRHHSFQERSTVFNVDTVDVVNVIDAVDFTVR